MSEQHVPAMMHVSSAVVTAWPANCADLAQRIAALPGTEVWHAEGSRIIVVMEADSSDAISCRLAEIASLPGTLSANLVFEHAERPDCSGEQP